MARYIDAVQYAETISEKLDISLQSLVDVFVEIPTADVVEVVRCKDCKHWEEIERRGGYNHNGFCMMQSKIFYSERPATDADHFCSYGKRKDDT